MNGEQKELLEALADTIKDHGRRSDNFFTAKNASAILIPLTVAAVLWWFSFGNKIVTRDDLNEVSPWARDRPSVISDLERQQESIEKIEDDVKTISHGQIVIQVTQKNEAEKLAAVADDVSKILKAVQESPL